MSEQNLPHLTSFMLKNQPDQTSYLLNQMIDKVNTGNIAKASSGGSATLYPTTGQNTDGAMTQKATTDALNTKANSSDVNVALQNKVDKVAGKGLSENDFTDALKTKLENLDPSGEENVIEKIQKNGTDLPISNKTVNVTVPTKTSDLTNNSNFVSDANYVHTDNNYTSSDKSDVAEIDGIVSKIPAQASSSNKLADKAFVNSSVQTATANFRGNWASWSAVPTNASLYPVDYAGSHTPTVNDYLVVQDASDYTEETLEGTWRFKYSGTWATDGKNGWNPEYQVNETPMTAAQLAALNSGITSAAVTKLSGIQAGAEVNVQTDWNQTNTSADDYLKNKPTLGSLASKNEVQTGDIVNEAVTAGKLDSDTFRYFARTTTYDGVYISANSDLNTLPFCQVNRFVCNQTSTAGTLMNCPTTEAFDMDVYCMSNSTIDIPDGSQWEYLVREITDFGGNKWVQRVSSDGSGVFSYGGWRRIITSSDTKTVTAGMIADNAVTVDKIDFTTFSNGVITSLNTNSTNSGYWRKLGNLTFSSHKQGEFTFMRIFVGDGNNGIGHQNAFIDLTGQLGWTGSLSGRAGWASILFPLKTTIAASTFQLKIIANSNTNYDIWLKWGRTYCVPCVLFFPSVNNATTWTPDISGSWTSTEPSGTACDIVYCIASSS